MKKNFSLLPAASTGSFYPAPHSLRQHYSKRSEEEAGITKRPSQSKDLYRLLRTLRSDPAVPLREPPREEMDRYVMSFTNHK